MSARACACVALATRLCACPSDVAPSESSGTAVSLSTESASGAVASASAAVRTESSAGSRMPGNTKRHFTTPNEFLSRGLPTFVVGTLGDDAADRAVAGQAALIQGLLFPRARLVTDSSIDVAKGPSAWPPNPTLYGGPHVSSLLAALAPSLPFEMTSGRLVLGGETFSGDGIVLAAVVPARAPDANGPGYPELLVFAGTGMPGVAEINSASRGSEALFVGDAFGKLASGTWRDEANEVGAVFDGPRAPRLAWQTVTRKLRGATITFGREAAAPDEESVDACMRGLRTAVDKLKIDKPVPLSVYLYPDHETKRRLSGKGGDGHAVAFARALHVVARRNGLEKLMAHEGTHVFASAAWGQPGTPLLGEGLAVWVSGQYGGKSLAEWRRAIKPGPLEGLLGNGFLSTPEPESYPRGGLLVEAAIKQVGLAGLREHLYGASAQRWADACTQAGTTPARLEHLE